MSEEYKLNPMRLSDNLPSDWLDNLHNQIVALQKENDALRKQLEIATDGLIKIGDEYDGTRPAKMANKILQDMSLAAIEKMNNDPQKVSTKA
jgi:hypothetical protein